MSREARFCADAAADGRRAPRDSLGGVIRRSPRLPPPSPRRADDPHRARVAPDARRRRASAGTCPTNIRAPPSTGKATSSSRARCQSARGPGGHHASLRRRARLIAPRISGGHRAGKVALATCTWARWAGWTRSSPALAALPRGDARGSAAAGRGGASAYERRWPATIRCCSIPRRGRPQGLWAKKPLTSLGDLSGLRVRTADGNATITMRRGRRPAFADLLRRRAAAC
jgi:hypothetical protein